MKQILIADDHRLFAEGIQFMLSYSDEYRIIDVISDGSAVLPLLQAQLVDLLIMDVNMPEMSGIEVTRQVRLLFPDIPILAVSMQADYETVRAMFDAGANGFCLKSSGRNELFQALDQVIKGNVFLSPELTAVLTQARPLKNSANLLKLLTIRESEISKLLVEGYSNTDIAERLFVSPRTIETHRKNIYGKLGIHHVTELTAYVLKHHSH